MQAPLPLPLPPSFSVTTLGLYAFINSYSVSTTSTLGSYITVVMILYTCKVHEQLYDSQLRIRILTRQSPFITERGSER